MMLEPEELQKCRKVVFPLPFLPVKPNFRSVSI